MRSEVQVLLDPPFFLGALAQLGERLICIQEVIGSIPIGSTKTLLHVTIERIRECAGSSCEGRIDIVQRETTSVSLMCPSMGSSGDQAPKTILFQV